MKQEIASLEAELTKINEIVEQIQAENKDMASFEVYKDLLYLVGNDFQTIGSNMLICYGLKEDTTVSL